MPQQAINLVFLYHQVILVPFFGKSRVDRGILYVFQFYWGLTPWGKTLVETSAFLSYRVSNKWELNSIISGFDSTKVPNSRAFEILLDTMSLEAHRLEWKHCLGSLRGATLVGEEEARLWLEFAYAHDRGEWADFARRNGWQEQKHLSHTNMQNRPPIWIVLICLISMTMKLK